MKGSIPNDLLMRFLQAKPEQRAVIERVLAGELPTAAAKAPSGPLLMGMSASAQLLGVSRSTIWRMIQAGRLSTVEVLPGSRRVRKADLEAIAKS